MNWLLLGFIYLITLLFGIVDIIYTLKDENSTNYISLIASCIFILFGSIGLASVIINRLRPEMLQEPYQYIDEPRYI